MQLTDALLGEHGAFYMLFNQVEDIATIEGAMAQIRAATTVLATMVDSHAKIEEDLLFTALSPYLGQDAGPLAVMTAEHREMEQLLGQIEDVDEVEQAVYWVADALSAARSHFRKEEEVLFPMARRILGADALTKLGTDWARTRKVCIV